MAGSYPIAVMLRAPLCTLLLLSASALLGAAHGVYVSLRCHRAGTHRRWEAARGRGKPWLCKAGIPGTLGHPSEQAGRRGAGSGQASRRGRAGRPAGRSARPSWLLARVGSAAAVLCARTRFPVCATASGADFEVLPHLSSFVVWGEGLQAARGAILGEFGLHGALRKEKNGVRRGSCSGVTGIFAFGDTSLLKHLVRFSLATCWPLLVWGVHRLAGNLSSFRVERVEKRQTAAGGISGPGRGGPLGAEAR